MFFFYSGVVPCDMTDHDIIFAVEKKSVPKSQVLKTRFKFCNFNIANSLLAQADWAFVHENTSAIDKFSRFHQIVIDCITASTQTFPQGRRQLIRKPWITKGLLLSIKRRSNLHHNVRQNPDNRKLRENYTKYRNMTTKLLRISKTKYFQTKFHDAFGDSRRSWNLINCALGKPKPSTDVLNIINDEGKITSDTKVICQTLNNYFTDIASMIPDSAPIVQHATI